MIDKLEVGVKYKLIDRDGYINCHSCNEDIVNKHLTNGCLILRSVDCQGYGYMVEDPDDDGDVIVISPSEYRYFCKAETDQPVEMEYRVLRRNNKHQVCDWRKGVKLYEDSYGTLIRNNKRTKFYTGIVEWRECQDVPTEDLKVASDIIKKLNPQQLKNFAMILNAEIAALTLSRSNK